MKLHTLAKALREMLDLPPDKQLSFEDKMGLLSKMEALDDPCFHPGTAVLGVRSPPGNVGMDDREPPAALISALTAEHFVLQSAASATVSEAASRASLYVLSLSSSLIAMGFVSQSRELFLPFAATVLPALFVLGIFTVVRLIDTGIENQQMLTGIARIRSYYRTLAPDAAELFSAKSGRWPESQSAPPLWLGSLVGFMTTAASMIAFINNIVAGAAVSLLANNFLLRDQTVTALLLGVVTALALMVAFLFFQRWKYRVFAPAVADVDRKK